MKKNSSYMTRALAHSDPRFAIILGKLGHTAPENPEDAKADNLKDVRAEYEAVFGKKPFNGWKIEQLKAKIAEAKKADI